MDELKELGLTLEDCKICEEDFDTHFSKKLKKNPEMYAAYMKEVAEEFNKKHSIGVLLAGLKCLVMAGNVTEIAKQTGIPRTNIYKLLESNNNPSFATVLKLIEALGLNLKLTTLSKRRKTWITKIIRTTDYSRSIKTPEKDNVLTVCEKPAEYDSGKTYAEQNVVSPAIQAKGK
jgi:probable addiction module antidote protein